MGDGVNNPVSDKINKNDTNSKSTKHENDPHFNESRFRQDSASMDSDVIINLHHAGDALCDVSAYCDGANCGFNLLPLEGDSFLGDEKDDSVNGDSDVTNIGKRNRQDSCNSTATRKVNKKSRKKSSKKLELDAEIEKIMADIEMNAKPMQAHAENLMSREAATGLDAKENKKVSKKKNKKKTRANLTMANGGHSATINENGILESDSKDQEKVTKTPKKNESSKSSSEHEDKAEETSESKTGRKKPSKKQLAVIHAALKKAEEEKERLRQEEILRQKRAEEAEKLRLEKLQQEEERKLKKKQKEKEKRERLKAQGKILTKAQKLARIRTEASKSFWRERISSISKSQEEAAKVEENGLHKKDSLSSTSEDDACFCPSSSQESMSQETIENNSGVNNIPERSRHYSETKILNGNDNFICDTDTLPRRRFQSDMSISDSELGTCCNNSLAKTQSLHSLNSKGKVKTQSSNEDVHFNSKYRSPVVCVLGHVDTGKTKILDTIRKTHVQANEAGGITQQIGATMVPRHSLKEKCAMVNSFASFDLELPGLLIIDTPGHESFRNLRFRGSSLCDIAILVVDIMHGLEPQTIESINLLRERRTPFIVALNKVDRIYGWQPSNKEDIEDTLRKQTISAKMEFEKRCQEVILQFAKESLNVALYYENSNPKVFASMVPVSAVSGDGMGNLLALVCQLTQSMMANKLLFSEELQATVLEVKTTHGLGTTIDVILVNGHLKEGDTIVLAGQDGAIVSQIRSILLPQPLKELRVKNPFFEAKQVEGAQGIKISGRDLDKVIAGLPLYVSNNPEHTLMLKDQVTSSFSCVMNSIKLSERGVYVQASTLGSLEALLELLKSKDISYAGIKVGPVVKKDVIKASVMLEHDIQYAVILAFDVKIERDAQDMAENLGIKIFQADIIYHLFDSFVDYRDKLLEKRKNDAKKLAVFPCKLRILPEYVFSVHNPLVFGVRVESGILKVGTPLCVPSKNALSIGQVTLIEFQHQSIESAKTNDEVSIKVETIGDESNKTYGKHFDHEDILVSKISRQTIDVCKEFHRKDLSKSDWTLMKELKCLLNIV